MNRDDLYNKVDRLLDDYNAPFGNKDRIYVIARLLMNGFAWDRTQSPHNYWHDFYEELLQLSESYGSSASTPNKVQGAQTGVGSAISITALLARVDQDLLDVKATLEAEQAKPEPAKKLVKFMTYALHKLEGREAFGERGLVAQLKDADV
jgi:hypothetical protein